MKKKFSQVYQFKITLMNAKPPIWRRIHVPDTYTFWDLHVAIQDAMGWLDYHLHQFEILDPKKGEKVTIGIPSEDDIDYSWEILPGWRQRISDYFSLENKVADYVYDFGDNWQHKITLEKVLPRDKDSKYPRCIKGKRACPPKDCGGAWGYADLLKAIKDPKHEEHERMLEWAGGEFDPEHFDTEEIHFDNPVERRKLVYE